MDVTLAARLQDVDARAYDDLVLRSPAGHAAQTRAWADLARASGPFTTFFALIRSGGVPVGAALVRRPTLLGVGLPWALVERGPVVTRVEEVGAVAAALARALRRRAVARLRVMPYFAGPSAEAAEEGLRSAGFRDVQTFAGAHVSTLRIAIGSKSDDEIFAGKSRQPVRNRIHQAVRAGAVGRLGHPEDWAALRETHSALMRAQGLGARGPAWWAALERFLGDTEHGAMFVCEWQGRFVAACVVVRHGAMATYSWGAAIPDKLPFTKAVPPLVAAIRWARDCGCTVFDLGGIPEESDRDPKRNAIATFKLDFDRTRVRLVREHAGWSS